MREDKARLMPLLLWEARVYMSPKWPPGLHGPPAEVEVSAQIYAYARAQFEARQAREGYDTYSWNDFQNETGIRSEAQEVPCAPPEPRRPSENSRKHGLYSQKLMLSPEEAVILDRLRTEMQTIHKPATAETAAMVNQIAEWTIRLRQLRGYEVDSAEPWVNMRAQVRKVIKATEKRIQQAEAALDLSPKPRSRAKGA